MRKQTIGLVLNTTPSYSETFFVNKVNSLQKAGFRVVLFARKKGNVPREWEVRQPYPLPENNLLRLFLLAGVFLKLIVTIPSVVFNFIRLERADGISPRKIMEHLYINAHILPSKLDWLHFGFATTGIMRENVAAAIGSKMAVSIRGYDIAVYPLKHRACYDLLWKKIDRLHTISDDLLEVAYRWGLSKATPVTRITPAIEFGKFDVGSRVDGGQVNILTVARLNWKKGIRYAIHAMKILTDANVSFTYTIIGEGEDWDNLLFMCHQLGIADKVKFAGKVSSDKIGDYYKQNTIYLQPSVQEGFCNAVLEAQAAGLLCIVSDAEGLPENVLNGATGWVIPKRQPAAIANAILGAISITQNEKEKLVFYARERVKTEFSLEKQTSEFVQFYS